MISKFGNARTNIKRSQNTGVESMFEVEKLQFNIQARSMLISGDINEETLEEVYYFTTTLAVQEDGDPAIIYISSGGGNIAECRAILDIINSDDNIKGLVAIGEVCSAAAMIFSMFTKKRIIGSNSLLMFHKPIWEDRECKTAEDFKAWAEYLQLDESWLLDTITQRCGVETGEFLETKLTEPHFWLTATEAVDWNFADLVLSSPKEVKEEERDRHPIDNDTEIGKD